MENYLRKYRILITDKGNTALDVSDMRATFCIEKKAIQSVNYANAVIYNLSSAAEAAIVREGHGVIIEAGYENGAYGKIFDGEVFQPLLDRENVVDFRLELHCIDGDSLLHMNFVNFVMAAGYDYNTSILNMARNARTPIPVDHITESLKKSKAPRGKVIFGDWRDKAREISLDNGAQFYVNDGKLNVMNVTDVSQDEALVISPENGLVGTPQQIDCGFTFRCLLNPNIKLTNPCMRIKLDNTIIQQEKAIQGQMISMLDQNMFGIVIGMRHIGDTRGGDWYTDVVCLTKGGKAPLALAGGGDALPDLVTTGKENTN